MAIWNLRKLTDTIKQEQFEPLYLLYGDEPYLIADAFEQLKLAALGDGLVDFNLNVFYGVGLDAGQALDAIQTLPMMAARRVIIIKDAGAMKDSQWAVLNPIFENPVETSVVILLADKIDKRKKYIKDIMSKGVLLEVKRPFENQIPGWIEHICRKHGVGIVPDAVRLLHQFVGGHLGDLDSEIKKLKGFIGERKKIEPEDVNQVVSRTRVDSVFDLTNAIGENNRGEALACLVNLLDHGQSEIGIVALVARHLRILMDVQQSLSLGLRGKDLASKAGVPPFFVDQYVHQTKKWTPSKLKRAHALTYDLDKTLKSSALPSHICLENFVLQVCQ